jgi:hypothetical protein
MLFRFFFTLIMVISLYLILIVVPISHAEECHNLKLDSVNGDYYSTCPDDNQQIHCYHYRWHWVCEKGDVLYWDRRLESAALSACGCPLPDDIAPATPAISIRPSGAIQTVNE